MYNELYSYHGYGDHNKEVPNSFAKVDEELYIVMSDHMMLEAAVAIFESRFQDILSVDFDPN